ncbi:MAG: aminotransferase class I/II-fold pyridoxal phosphate-dependent enzyme [Oscillospiraceae bacterium]|nr:aminotransferase class I/II-fold pyridoxal phosphate-dependent enzyme [Oscillospiraceae bacterium]
MEQLPSRLLHRGDGQFAKKLARAVSVPETFPVYLSSVYAFDDLEAVDAVYEKEADGYIYARIAAPNADAVSEILAAADGGGDALVFASGMAAITTSVLAVLSPGDHLIASPILYGGVNDFFKNELPRLGVEVTFADLAELEAHIRPNTKLVYTETISNPLVTVPDIRAAAALTRAKGLLFFVDNTFASPVVVQPLSLGADLALYSVTKYLGGHSDIVGGAAVGGPELIPRIRRALVLYGGILSPTDCWLLARSLRTLDLRVRRHSENALAVARFLESHPKVERVYYPGLPASPSHANALRQFTPSLFGGMLSADIAGGERAAAALVRALTNIPLVPSLAGTATTLSHSAKTSHRFYDKKTREALGILDGQLRFSVGLEAREDILSELEQALDKI